MSYLKSILALCFFFTSANLYINANEKQDSSDLCKTLKDSIITSYNNNDIHDFVIIYNAYHSLNKHHELENECGEYFDEIRSIFNDEINPRVISLSEPPKKYRRTSSDNCINISEEYFLRSNFSNYEIEEIFKTIADNDLSYNDLKWSINLNIQSDQMNDSIELLKKEVERINSNEELFINGDNLKKLLNQRINHIEKTIQKNE